MILLDEYISKPTGLWTSNRRITCPLGQWVFACLVTHTLGVESVGVAITASIIKLLAPAFGRIVVKHWYDSFTGAGVFGQETILCVELGFASRVTGPHAVEVVGVSHTAAVDELLAGRRGRVVVVAWVVGQAGTGLKRQGTDLSALSHWVTGLCHTLHLHRNTLLTAWAVYVLAGLDTVAGGTAVPVIQVAVRAVHVTKLLRARFTFSDVVVTYQTEVT